MKDIEVSGYEVQEIDVVRVKGRETPVNLYTFRPSRMLAKGELQLWKRVLDSYRDGDFKQSLAQCKELHNSVPGFALYELFLARCERYCADPPTHWDPVFSHLSK